MNKSRWLRAIARGETLVIDDEAGGWWIIWEGALCTPTFNSKGAAGACLSMYERGDRQPEL